MNVEIERLLEPHMTAVQTAHDAYTDTHLDPTANPHHEAADAHTLIQAQAAALELMWDLLDRLSWKAECGCEETLRLQGRLNRLHDMQHGTAS
jgi:hypothetical protein